MGDLPGDAARLRTGMRWLVVCSVLALIGLVGWFAYGVAVQSAAMMTAAGAGAAAVAASWSSGYAAMRMRLRQLVPRA